MHLAILTPSYPGTTFAASELDFQVRDVTGYFLTAIDTPKLYFNLGSSFFNRSGHPVCSGFAAPAARNLTAIDTPKLYFNLS